MEVTFFKLVTGDEVLAKAKREVGHWILEKAVRLAFTPQGVAMAPYSPLLKTDSIKLLNEHIMFHGEVADEVYNAYSSRFGSGLVLPTGSGLKVADDEE